MKKVLVALFFVSLLLSVQACTVNAGSLVWTTTVDITCGPLAASPSASNYFLGDTMTWTVAAGCADSVRVEFPASNPWFAAQTVEQFIRPTESWESDATAREGDFTYKIVLYQGGARVDSINATIGWIERPNPVPSLSTWAALVLVLSLIVVTIALLRKRMRVGA